MSLYAMRRRLEALERKLRRLDIQRAKSRRRRRRWPRRCYALFLKTGGARVLTDLLKAMPKDLLEAFLAQDDMENTRQYLAAGRFWWRLSDEQLKAGWLATWRSFFLNDKAKAADIHGDLCAELRLREIDPPLERITAEEHERALSAATESIAADAINQRRLVKDLEQFRRELTAPKN